MTEIFLVLKKTAPSLLYQQLLIGYEKKAVGYLLFIWPRTI